MFASMLNECINDMKEVKEIENMSYDSKKQGKTDDGFITLANQYDMILNFLNLAYRKANFVASVETRSLARSILSKIEKIVESGIARDDVNNQIMTECKKLDTEISVEWKQFYSDKSVGLLSLLDTVIDITDDRIKTQQSINKIKKGANFPNDEKDLNFLQSGLSEAEETIKNLGLDDDIILFLKKVGNGGATLADITSDILGWIEREHLESKIAISFSAL